MDLHQEIMKRSEAYLKSDKFSDALQKQVEDTIHDAVKSMFSYGELRDTIREGLKEKVAIDLAQIDFAHINQVVTDLVKLKCHNAFKGPLLEKLAKELDEMFKPAPKEITLQGFVDMWKEDLKEEACGCDRVENILVEISRSEYDRDGSGKLRIWNGGKKTRSTTYSGDRDIQPDLELFIGSDGKISIIWDVTTKEARNSLATDIYGKEAQVFMMYCAGTVITDFKTVDTDDLDTSIHDEY